MKKIGALLFLLMTVACTVNSGEEKFVNPIFYKVMSPVSSRAWYTQITPTEMISSNNKGDTVRQSCVLIENTMDTVVLECVAPYPELIVQDDETHKMNHYLFLYKFVLDPNIEAYGGIFVHMYSKSLDDKRDFGDYNHSSLAID